MKKTLTLYLRERENVLHERWRSSIDSFTARIGQFHPDSSVYREIIKLMMELVSIVEKRGDTEQIVDESLQPIVSHLKNLQTDYQLTSLEIFFVLSLMRNILRDMMGDSTGPEGSALGEALTQVSSLLNRLGLIFFEGAMRLKEDKGFDHQDVLAIEYALLYERTRQIAITDRLTGLYNFGYFMERLKEERVRAERYHRLLSLIILDIDHFKTYNDTNGHPAGNEVLKKIAEILKDRGEGSGYRGPLRRGGNGSGPARNGAQAGRRNLAERISGAYFPDALRAYGTSILGKNNNLGGGRHLPGGRPQRGRID